MPNGIIILTKKVKNGEPMDLKQFLSDSLTAFHAVALSKAYLSENGFEKLDLTESWSLKKGGKYFVEKNGSALIAFRIGENFAFNVAASHTDSPSLHVKGSSLIPSPEGMRLNVEKYGGLILYSFMDAPLKIAGRILVERDGAVAVRLVESPYLVTIPSLAIHHNPSVNEGFSFNVQNDMLPLLGSVTDFYGSLTDEKVLDADLYVVPCVKPYESGVNSEFLSSPRIDNLTSVYSSLIALNDCSPSSVAVCCCFDNEEIGSGTKQGANSVLIERVLKKIAFGLGKTEEDYSSACEKGFVLSVDNAHATHPAHPEKSDPEQKVLLNKGIVVKHHVNYSTDGVSSAIFKAVLDKAGVKYQDYFNRSDLRCGSTIGLMLSANLGMDACDVGLAQLAMHSGVETAGKFDVDEMTAGLTAFFNAKINKTDNEFTF